MKYIYCFVIGILLYLLLNRYNCIQNYRRVEKFSISANGEPVVPRGTVEIDVPPGGHHMKGEITGFVEHELVDLVLGPGTATDVKMSSASATAHMLAYEQ